MDSLVIFWRGFGVVTAVILAAGAGVLAAAGQWPAAASFAAGVVVSASAVVLLGFSAASYVQTGLRASRGERAAGGGFLRGGLLTARLVLVGAGIALALSWRPLNLPAFVAGLGMAQIGVVLAALRAGR